MFEFSPQENKPASAIVLSSNLLRCVTLCIKSDAGGLFGLLFYDFLHTSMPLLVNLTIHERKPHTTSIYMWRPPTVDIYAGGMPNLRVLDVYGLSLTSERPLATVTDVKCSIMASGRQEMLKGLPNLEILSLSFFRTFVSSTKTFDEKLVLPSLKVLELAYVDSAADAQPDYHTPLVDRLILPMLETVALRDVAQWPSLDWGSHIVHCLVRIL